MDTIRVKITKPTGRRFFVMYYDDPLTLKRFCKSSKEETKGGAQKAAGKWEAELREGRYSAAGTIEWAEFRERYELEVLPSLADGTATNCGSVFNALEAAIKLKYLRDLTPQRLSKFQATMRESGKAEATIGSYLGQLLAALAWGVSMGLLPAVPKVKRPARAKAGGKMMKGRPITTEEFERMLDKVQAGLLAMNTRLAPKQRTLKRIQSADVVDRRNQDRQRLVTAAVPSWRHLLRGLWLSSLRLEEALNLSWNEPDKMHVDLSGRRPMLRIHAHLEKGKKDRLLPITPDFAEFLLATPEAKRQGPVFNPLGASGRGAVRNRSYAGHVITAIGKAAGVKVEVSKNGKVKFASAHDLRRSFGARWAVRVMPAVLQQLMRHENIETTMRFYVGQNSEATADAVYAAFERSMVAAATQAVNTFVNSGDILSPVSRESPSQL